MRASASSLLFALALSALSFSSIRAEPSHRLVVALARTAPGEALANERFSRARLEARVAPLGLSVARSFADGLPPAAPVRSLAARIPSPRVNPFDLDRSRIWLLEARDSLSAASAAQSLLADRAIEWIEFDQPREPAMTGLATRSVSRAPDSFPDDPLFRDSRQWGLVNRGPAGAYGGLANADVHAAQAWMRSTGSENVRLAVADTGIDPSHPDLNALLTNGWRIEHAINVTADPSAAVTDSFGHGTPVAGVMAARTGEGAHFDSLGIAGMCGGDGRANPGCRLIALKITSGRSGGASSFDVARAIVAATDLGARAMNLSFAGSGGSRLERLALYYAIASGCVVVAAAGNQGAFTPTAPQYPAAYARDGLCIQVGASDPFDRRVAFSSYGPGLDVIAPGVNIWTTYMTYPSAAGVSYDGYVAGSGTSFAAPFATGAVGLLAAARPELIDTDFQRVLRESATDVGAPGVDAETGWGRLDAAAALAAVDPAIGIWHDEAAADRFFDGAIDTLRVIEDGPGMMSPPRVWPRARVIEATATIALPDSFLDGVRVWPRIGGTMAVAPGFRLPYFAPWAEVARIDSRSFTLRGYLYRDESGDSVTVDTSIPLPADQARFGFTVMGRVDRPPSLTVLSPLGFASAAAAESLVVSWRATDPDQVTAIEVWLDAESGFSSRLARVAGNESTARVGLPCPLPASGRCALRVAALDEHGPHRDRTDVALPLRVRAFTCGDAPTEHALLAPSPNPFRGSVRIAGPPGAGVSIIDLSGRIVRRGRLDGSLGAFVWDGRDATGRHLGPGLYWVRCDRPGERKPSRVLKLE